MSTPSTLTFLSDHYYRRILDRTITTEEYERQAFAHLRQLDLDRRNILNTPIDAYQVLVAILGHAPTERGRRYAACAILSCRGQDQLVGLADDWLKFLLWPCMF
jgi:hypothetical protein